MAAIPSYVPDITKNSTSRYATNTSGYRTDQLVEEDINIVLRILNQAPMQERKAMSVRIEEYLKEEVNPNKDSPSRILFNLSYDGRENPPTDVKSNPRYLPDKAISEIVRPVFTSSSIVDQHKRSIYASAGTAENATWFVGVLNTLINEEAKHDVPFEGKFVLGPDTTGTLSIIGWLSPLVCNMHGAYLDIANMQMQYIENLFAGHLHIPGLLNKWRQCKSDFEKLMSNTKISNSQKWSPPTNRVPINRALAFAAGTFGKFAQ